MEDESVIKSEVVADTRQQEFSTDLLRLYYDRLFPYDAMFNWLSYGQNPEKEGNDKGTFQNREWSFTIEDDIYIRYQSFANKGEMVAAIKKRQPHKIDIGAIFTGHPKDHATIKPELFKPIERELVFDVDMTDYDDIRTCCKGAAICPRCWGYMTMAVKVVDVALRDDFGFRNILWVYSGRRGVHCWVCDPAARALTNEARGAVVDYLTVHTGTKENSDRKVKNTYIHPMHPMIRRAYDLLEPYFKSHIADRGDDVGQGLLASVRTSKTEKGEKEYSHSYTKVLNTMPDETLRVELYNSFKKDDRESGASRWERIVRACTPDSDPNGKKRKTTNYTELDAWRYELVLTHCYARLDINVSKTQNHLLKSPFCVHPKTGRVCIPINPHDADSFDPFTVPTLRSLMNELDAYSGPEVENDSDKTSMKTVLDTFNAAFMGEMNKVNRKAHRDASERQAAVTMDF